MPPYEPPLHRPTIPPITVIRSPYRRLATHRLSQANHLHVISRWGANKTPNGAVSIDRRLLAVGAFGIRCSFSASVCPRLLCVDDFENLIGFVPRLSALRRVSPSFLADQGAGEGSKFSRPFFNMGLSIHHQSDRLFFVVSRQTQSHPRAELDRAGPFLFRVDHVSKGKIAALSTL